MSKSVFEHSITQFAIDHWLSQILNALYNVACPRERTVPDQNPLTILCLASYEKGEAFLRE
jgi:hypothetical protein